MYFFFKLTVNILNIDTKKNLSVFHYRNTAIFVIKRLTLIVDSIKKFMILMREDKFSFTDITIIDATLTSYTRLLHATFPSYTLLLHAAFPSHTLLLHAAFPIYTLLHAAFPSYTLLLHAAFPSYTRALVLHAAFLSYTLLLHAAFPSYTRALLHIRLPSNMLRIMQTRNDKFDIKYVPINNI